ncbi:MAG: glycoside hydrolase 43 family protein [Dysgonamonadaceae bacterium]|jgi:beta-xylosidase|nr:glycoside hydrolase 43 family protein [Dysgonamonadaceae bacterium]
MKNIYLAIILFISFIPCKTIFAQAFTAWGDQGNGTYVNPILNADYSDPDVIRFQDKYYMVSSDFHYIGMPVLESDDMVNWKIISQIYDRFDFPKWEENGRYAGGSWAPAIRYHDGKFWVFFCTPDEGLFMSNATDPAGPWSKLTHVKDVPKWEDPCPLWDDDGQAYLGRSQKGAGPIIIHKMNPEGTELLDEGKTVYTGPVAEGTKFLKKDGYYYLIIPEGSVHAGWQTVLHSKNIYGPYEKKVVLEQGSTDINGPHQGALVDTPEGEWWFFHFQQTEPLGRVVHLQPVFWKDGWPYMGVDIDMNGIGEPVRVWKKPNVGKIFPISFPQTDDDFSSPQLGLQWQFNHNPANDAWSLTDRKGYITFHALKADNLRNARNTLTQKSMGYIGEAVVKMDIRELAEGQRAGLCCMGNLFNGIGIVRENGKNFLYLEKHGEIEKLHPIKGTDIYLKASLNAITNEHQLYYSLDNKNFTPCGNAYALKFGFWKGSRIGLFSYNTIEENGKVYFDWFRYKHDGSSVR